MADLERYRLPECPQCLAVGTIVEMGLCCRIWDWIRMGGLWEEERGLRTELPPRRRPYTRRAPPA